MRSSARILSYTLAIVVGTFHAMAFCQIGATISYTTQQVSASSYEYDFTLNNTGSTPIGTFWFGWYTGTPPYYPAYDLLPSTASSVSSPMGWSGSSVHDGVGGYAIEWFDTSAPLAAGQSLGGFSITTPDAPGTLAGPSLLGSYYPVSTSWVYVGQLQDGANPADRGVLLTATASTVPEPGAALLIPAIVLVMIRKLQ
jgi:hypothetical protein